MSNVYSLLKYLTRIRSTRIKAAALWVAHVAGRRYLNVNLDPVMGCNLRCQMCYFSSEEKGNLKPGRLSMEQYRRIADGLFHRVLRLQIGCGAEPTLHTEMPEMVRIGRERGVPFISITTNGNMLSRQVLEQCVGNGLNELCLSCHGFTQPMYELMMEKARFDLFLDVLASVREVKRSHPDFKLRINYTINTDNKDDLLHIWDVVGDELDVLQIRPVQNLGASKYQNFDLSSIKANYTRYIGSVVEECERRGILCLAPTEESLAVLEESNRDDSMMDYNPIMEYAYCYVSPSVCWREDYDTEKDDFASYTGRRHVALSIFKDIFKNANRRKKDVPTVALNYSVK